MFPKLAKASNDSEGDAFVEMIEKSISILFSICIPFAIIAMLIPKILIRIVAGELSLDASPILQIYLVISIIGIFQNQSSNALNSLGRSKICFMLNLFGLIKKVVVVSVCLISFGLLGAAIGNLITSIISFFVWNEVIKKYVFLGGEIFLKIMLKIILFHIILCCKFWVNIACLDLLQIS